MLLLSPGPNMAFVLAHGVAYGASGGAAAALGITAADLILTVLTATGITAIVAAWTPALDAIRYAGAAYLLWMAYQAWSRRVGMHHDVKRETSLTEVFVRAMLNGLLNPKALLFFMVFLPQFVDPGHGAITTQLIVLGCVLAAIAAVFHVALGAGAGPLNRMLSGRSTAVRLQSRALAVVLALLALRLVLMTHAS